MNSGIKKNILLVEPDFPIPGKSKNHSNFLPIGLLKLASYYINLQCEIQLIRGNHTADFYPTEIYITSLFTYWSNYVKDSVEFYKANYPKAKVIVGGIYATLMPDHCKEFTGCDEVFKGQHAEADLCLPAYDLIEVDYQIIHGMRGCTRKCPFCGIWKIEELSYKNAEEIKNEICKNKLVFYDNNILVNPHIDSILTMISNTILNKRVIKCESQSGFDGRILAKKPYLAQLLKNARFENIRLAWDFSIEQHTEVENWISILENAGYNRRSIFIFMVYNWSFDYKELEAKRRKCFEWNVQIADCRFRPLDQTYDNYNPYLKNQTNDDYYIHSNWTDTLIKKFRKDVRKHNICIRYKIHWDKYEKKLETIYAKKSFVVK